MRGAGPPVCTFMLESAMRSESSTTSMGSSPAIMDARSAYMYRLRPRLPFESLTRRAYRSFQYLTKSVETRMKLPVAKGEGGGEGKGE